MSGSLLKKTSGSLAGQILKSLEHVGELRTQGANVSLASALKELLVALLRANAGSCGALDFYLNCEAFGVNIILIPESPL